MSKFLEANQKIADKVVASYEKIEDGVVTGYKKVEDTVVGGFTKVADTFVGTFLTKDGESVEEAKSRLEEAQQARIESRHNANKRN